MYFYVIFLYRRSAVRAQNTTVGVRVSTAVLNGKLFTYYLRLDNCAYLELVNQNR